MFNQLLGSYVLPQVASAIVHGNTLESAQCCALWAMVGIAPRSSPPYCRICPTGESPFIGNYHFKILTPYLYTYLLTYSPPVPITAGNGQQQGSPRSDRAEATGPPRRLGGLFWHREGQGIRATGALCHPRPMSSDT